MKQKVFIVEVLKGAEDKTTIIVRDPQTNTVACVADSFDEMNRFFSGLEF